MRNNVRSNQFIQWCQSYKISILLYESEAGKNRVGSKWKRERERGADYGSERQSLGENLKWRGLRNDLLKRHLSIPNK